MGQRHSIGVLTEEIGPSIDGPMYGKPLAGFQKKSNSFENLHLHKVSESPTNNLEYKETEELSEHSSIDTGNNYNRSGECQSERNVLGLQKWRRGSMSSQDLRQGHSSKNVASAISLKSLSGKLHFHCDDQKLLELFRDEIIAIRNLSCHELNAIRDCDLEFNCKSGLINLLLAEAKQELNSRDDFERSQNSCDLGELVNFSLKNLTAAGDCESIQTCDDISVARLAEKLRVLKQAIEVPIKSSADVILKVDACVQKDDKSKNLSGNCRICLRHGFCCHDNEDQSVDSGFPEESVNSLFCGQNAMNLISHPTYHSDTTDTFALCDDDSALGSSCSRSSSCHFSQPLTDRQAIQKTESRTWNGKVNKMKQSSHDPELRRNTLMLHLMGTSKLREQLKNTSTNQASATSSGLLCGLASRPVHYRFWVPADEPVLRSFNSKVDRRILSISRLSNCNLKLLPTVRRDAHGIFVRQILVDSPSIIDLQRCCHMMDAKFPAFNASVGLGCRQNVGFDPSSRKIDFIEFLLTQMDQY